MIIRPVDNILLTNRKINLISLSTSLSELIWYGGWDKRIPRLTNTSTKHMIK